MTQLKQSVRINKPRATVFAFCIDPANTPKWVDSIVLEETNAWPVGVGTIYRNQDQQGAWSEYALTVFEPDTTFTLTKSDGNYLRYTFTPVSENETELVYEWQGDELEQALLQDILLKLKHVIEAA